MLMANSLKLTAKQILKSEILKYEVFNVVKS